MLSNGLVLLGAQYYIQDIVLGIIIIASVATADAAQDQWSQDEHSYFH